MLEHSTGRKGHNRLLPVLGIVSPLRQKQWPFEAYLMPSRLLARHQNVLDRLRVEIENTVGIGASAPQPTRNDLKKMTYLNLVVKEGRAHFDINE